METRPTALPLDMRGQPRMDTEIWQSGAERWIGEFERALGASDAY
ncbi:hypothetical protein ABZT28_31295 [Streptomyces sp. NPDC005388]